MKYPNFEFQKIIIEEMLGLGKNIKKNDLS